MGYQEINTNQVFGVNAEEKKQVISKIRYLDKKVGEIEISIDELKSRLKSVIYVEETTDKESAAPKESLCELAETISNLTDRLGRINYIAEFILNHLEL